MAYNYLGLVNDVNERVNEASLSSSNFATAVGHYANARQAVNSALSYINQQAFEWPFNHSTYSETLVAGQIRYPYQSTFKSVDFDSFRVQRNATFNNETRFLRFTSYEEYLKMAVDDEYNTTDTGIRTLPRLVFPTPDNGYGIWPAPDEAYTLDFEYYSEPTPLADSTDVPAFPASFRHIIVDGAMYYIYFFRGDIETADRLLAKFEEGIKNQRTIYINNDDHIYDTRVHLPYKNASILRTD